MFASQDGGLAFAETAGLDVAVEYWALHLQIDWGEHALSALRAFYWWIIHLDIEAL